MTQSADSPQVQRAKELLAFVIRYLEEHWYQPTVDEIAGGLNVKKEEVRRRLDTLVEMRVVTLAPVWEQRAIKMNSPMKIYRPPTPTTRESVRRPRRQT